MKISHIALALTLSITAATSFAFEKFPPSAYKLVSEQKNVTLKFTGGVLSLGEEDYDSFLAGGKDAEGKEVAMFITLDTPFPEAQADVMMKSKQGRIAGTVVCKNAQLVTGKLVPPGMKHAYLATDCKLKSMN